MRKKILGATFVVAMAAIAGYNTYVNQTKVEMSNMALANIEALADPEGEFPEDPYKNYGPSAYKKRNESNYYEYYINYWVNDSVAYIYKTPITEITCLGVGSVKCVENIYRGISEYDHTEIIK